MKTFPKIILALVLALVAWTALYLQLSALADWLSFGVLGLGRGTHLGSSVQFFLYDTPKVMMLLVLIVFGVGVLRSFFTPERTRRILAGRSEFSGNILASLLGVATPFCTCSAVPLFIGFVTAGVPLGVTFSFLIASPMINEIALVLLFGLFGWKVALLYAGTGLLIAIFAGWGIGRMKLEKWVEPWVYQTQTGAAAEAAAMDWPARVRYGLEAVRDIVGKVWPYVVLGIAVGAGIHGYVPQNFLASFMGRDAWWCVPLAVLLGVPMYSNAMKLVGIGLKQMSLDTVKTFAADAKAAGFSL